MWVLQSYRESGLRPYSCLLLELDLFVYLCNMVNLDPFKKLGKTIDILNLFINIAKINTRGASVITSLITRR